MDTALPETIGRGYVVFSAIHVGADSEVDVDRLPDVRPAQDLKIRFSPRLKWDTIPGTHGGPSTLVLRDPQDAGVNGDAVMIDATGEDGVWVVAGIHEVSILQGQSVLHKFDIEVTGAHTIDAPYDLADRIPRDPELPPLPGLPLVGLPVTQVQYDALARWDPQTVYFVMGAWHE